MADATEATTSDIVDRLHERIDKIDRTLDLILRVKRAELLMGQATPVNDSLLAEIERALR